MSDIKALQQQQTGKAEDLMVTGLGLRWDMASASLSISQIREKLKSTEHTMADCNKGFFFPPM